MVLLENKTDLLVAESGPFLGLQVMNRRFVKEIFTAPTMIVHSENVEQRRFSGAGRTHYGDELAGRNVDCDIAQNIKEFPVAERVTAFQISEPDHTLWPLGGDPAVLHYPAVEQVDGAIRVLREALVVRNHADRGAAGMQLLEQIHHRFPVAGVEIAGRFVRKQNCRPAGECARDGDALLLTARKLARQMFGAMRHSHAVERLSDEIFSLTGAESAVS